MKKCFVLNDFYVERSIVNNNRIITQNRIFRKTIINFYMISNR